MIALIAPQHTTSDNLRVNVGHLSGKKLKDLSTYLGIDPDLYALDDKGKTLSPNSKVSHRTRMLAYCFSRV